MFENIFTSNEFFQGGLALAIMGGFIASLRYLPKILIHYFQRFFTTTIYVRDDTLVSWLADWLDGATHRTRWYAGKVQNDTDGKRTVMYPGQGLHVIRSVGRRFWVWSSLEENGIAGMIQTFTIRCWGRNKAPLEELLTSVRRLAEERERGKNVTYINNNWGEWRKLKAGNRRYKESIVLIEGQREDILEDAGDFLASRDHYLKLGTPYRRGYLFQGPPGNGKSTMVQVIATEFRLPIYALALAEKDLSDSRLAVALGNIPEKAILLMEDADRIDFEKTVVTLSGLLNSIDGSLASEGRIFVVTANNPEKIDQAFKRAGRIDRIWDFNKPTIAQIETMMATFYTESQEKNGFAASCVAQEFSVSRVRNILQCEDEKMGRNRRNRRKMKEQTATVLLVDSKTMCHRCGGPAVFHGQDQKWRCPDCQKAYEESFGLVRVNANVSTQK